MNEIIFKNIIDDMKDKNLNMESVIITENNKEYKYIFHEEKRGNIRSLSKTVTCLALGIAIEKGLFKNGLEEHIIKYFSDFKIYNAANLQYLNEIKLKHLITLTVGYEDKLLYSQQLSELKGKDLCEFVLNYPIKHNPGEYFQYSNAPIYLLSVILESVTGMKLSQFVSEEILSKLEIVDFNWQESEQNHSMGCSGLELTGIDLHKVGKLILNKGIYNEKQVVSSNWISEMTKLQIKTPTMYDENRALPKYGYGYNLWICENGIFYHDGTAGQYIIVIPNKNIVITTTGNQTPMRPITECMRELFL